MRRRESIVGGCRKHLPGPGVRFGRACAHEPPMRTHPVDAANVGTRGMRTFGIDGRGVCEVYRMDTAAGTCECGDTKGTMCDSRPDLPHAPRWRAHSLHVSAHTFSPRAVPADMVVCRLGRVLRSGVPRELLLHGNPR